ncbi:MAG: hypothetical protein ACIAQZ_03705 [Sedimentisphaeraceae bacterium JB056]
MKRQRIWLTPILKFSDYESLIAENHCVHCDLCVYSVKENPAEEIF